MLVRSADLMMIVPIFLLMLVVILRPGVWVVIFVIALFAWTGPARIFRSQVVSVKQQDFVLAARTVGVPTWRILVMHVLPHLLPGGLRVASCGGLGALARRRSLIADG